MIILSRPFSTHESQPAHAATMTATAEWKPEGSVAAVQEASYTRQVEKHTVEKMTDRILHTATERPNDGRDCHMGLVTAQLWCAQ